MAQNRFLRQLEKAAAAQVSAPVVESTEPATTESATAEASLAEADAGADAPSQASETTASSRFEEMEAEIKKMRRSHHEQGRIDAVTLDAAQKYQALLADPEKRAALDGSQPKADELSNNAQQVMDAVDPEYREVIAALTRETMENDPRIIAAYQKIARLEAAQQTTAQAEIASAFNSFEKAVPEWKDNMSAQQQQSVANLSQTGEMSLVQAYEYVMDVKVSKAKANDVSKPPPEVNSVAGRLTEKTPKKFKSLHDAYASAKSENFKMQDR